MVTIVFGGAVYEIFESLLYYSKINNWTSMAMVTSNNEYAKFCVKPFMSDNKIKLK